MDITAHSDQGASGSSREDLEGNNDQPEQETEVQEKPKKGGRFGKMRLSFSKKKEQTETADGETSKLKVKRSKKEKKEKSSSNLPALASGAMGERKKSNSSIGSSLVRKMSFGKLKVKTVVTSDNRPSEEVGKLGSTLNEGEVTLPVTNESKPYSDPACVVSITSPTSQVITPLEEPEQAMAEQQSTKDQILAITTPLMEKQEPEIKTASDEPEQSEQHSTKNQILAITTPLMEKQEQDEQDTTPTNTSSRSDVFFTPRDTPSPPPLEAASTSLETDGSTSLENPGGVITSVETSFKTPEGEPGEDVMAHARARLSQSLGVSSTVSPGPQTAPAPMGDKREHLYKILVIGELGTGKTSIIKRYVHQFFSQHYRATIGVDFALKVLNWDSNTIIRLQLWDIAGQERFGNMTRVYYKEAVGAFIVFDVTRAATFDAVVKWKQDLDSKVQLPDGSPIPCVLLANKCDQQKEGLVNNPGKMDEYCKERGFSGWFETSAKENVNIEEAARSLVTKILENDQLGMQSESGSKDGDRFNLDGHQKGDVEQSKNKCSC